mgnify:CR=1 FL=1
MKRKMQRFVTVSTAAALSLAMAVPGSAAYQPEQKFQDVSRSAPYYEDVMDANYYGLMAGVSGKTFDTESTITRAMWVTMLYKMAGQPAVQSKDTFTDVKTGDWFAQAATWAVEQGITTGTSATTFSPDATVTRAQVVTFLWRANGQPAAGNSGFVDVSSNAYYAKAVDWAFVNGITTGMDYGAFGPDTACTRAQIVTFLYRAR